MIGKLVAFFGLVAVVSAQADKYPAGLNPLSCPNYPHCDNTLVAAIGKTYVGAPAVATHIAAPAPFLAAPAAPIATPLARELPAGVNPALYPNYPFSYAPAAPAVVAAPAPLAPVAPVAPIAHVAPLVKQWPAGVNPLEHPNYPYNK